MKFLLLAIRHKIHEENTKLFKIYAIEQSTIVKDVKCLVPKIKYKGESREIKIIYKVCLSNNRIKLTFTYAANLIIIPFILVLTCTNTLLQFHFFTSQERRLNESKSAVSMHSFSPLNSIFN